MIHRYKNNGYNVVLDGNSGFMHVVDEIVYDIIPLIEPLVREGIKDGDTIKMAVVSLADSAYSEQDILEAVDEVLEIEKDGQIFMQDNCENKVFDSANAQISAEACMALKPMVRKRKDGREFKFFRMYN